MLSPFVPDLLGTANGRRELPLQGVRGILRRESAPMKSWISGIECVDAISSVSTDVSMP